MMNDNPLNLRSSCPLSCFLDVLGDKWSFLIIRDLMFAQKNTFGEFLKSPEGIATNILTSRLLMLEKNGFIQKRIEQENKKVPVYQLTNKGYDLKPIMVEISLWAEKYFPISGEIKVQI